MRGKTKCTPIFFRDNLKQFREFPQLVLPCFILGSRLFHIVDSVVTQVDGEVFYAFTEFDMVSKYS